MEHIYDTIILGGGPAGLSAGLYAARSKMDTLLIEKAKFGGQIATTEEVDNYPGSMDNCTGPILVEKMRKQAEQFGTQIIKDEIVEVDFSEDIKTIKGKKNVYKTRSVIIATGATPRLAGFNGEEELRGRGVSYCATCDADFFTDLDVAVIGGGDSAVQEAIYLTKFVKNVTIIHRRDELRASKSLQDKAMKNSKIKFIWDTIVTDAIGEEIMEGLKLNNVKTGETSEFKVDGCFVFIGYLPMSDPFKGQIHMNDRGDIITDMDMRTNVPGVFAAGDVRETSLRQVITAAADGAMAATTAERYVEDKFNS